MRFVTPHWKILVLGLIASSVSGIGGGAGIPAIFNKVIPIIWDRETVTYTLWEIIGLASLIPLLFLIRGIFGFLGAYWMAIASVNISLNIKQATFDKLQSMSLNFYSRHNTGDILTRLQSDTGNVQTMLTEISQELFKQPVQMFAAMGYLIYYSWVNSQALFILVFCLGIPLFLIPVQILGKKLKRRGRQIQLNSAEVSQQISENLGALIEIRSFGMENAQKKSYFERNQQNAHLLLKLKKYERLQQPTMEIIVTTFIAIALVYCYQQRIGIDVVTTLGAALYFAFDPLKRIFIMMNRFNQLESSMERVYEILELDVDIKDVPTAQPIDRLSGKIEFKDVSFAYTTDSVLNAVNCTLPSGSVYALVGPSGSGKSTFAKLIPRFYEVTSGGISIDGIDVRNLRIEDLRRNIAVVSQSPVLFDESILENIRMGHPNATDDEVHSAARKAYAHDFILALPKGYETLAGERGDFLSGGQRQRIAIARAFLKNAPILILDEATSALDSESEIKIQSALETLVKGKTVIIIAHRFSTLRLADCILLMNSGKLEAMGNHQKLYQENELYKKLCDHQF